MVIVVVVVMVVVIVVVAVVFARLVLVLSGGGGLWNRGDEVGWGGVGWGRWKRLPRQTGAESGGRNNNKGGQGVSASPSCKVASTKQVRAAQAAPAYPARPAPVAIEAVVVTVLIASTQETNKPSTQKRRYYRC